MGSTDILAKFNGRLALFIRRSFLRNEVPHGLSQPVVRLVV